MKYPVPAKQVIFTRWFNTLGIQYFSANEFVATFDRVHRKVKNSYPYKSYWERIIPTLVVLSALREHFDAAVHLNSTYRSKDYNKAIAGAIRSEHTEFRAIDFTCDKGTPNEWASLLKSWRGKVFTLPNGEKFTFHGGIGLYDNFVHVDTRGYDADWTG